MPDGLPTDGLVIVAKRDCPTCVLVEPVMQSLDRAGPLAVVSQDDPTFPAGVRSVIDDQELERSFRLNIESRADPDPLQGRPRGRAHGGLGAQRNGCGWRATRRRARACRRGSRAAAPRASSPACTRR